MTYRIHDGYSEASITLTANTTEELRQLAVVEVAKRGWKDPWSEEVKHD